MQTKTAFISFCNRKTCFIGLTQSLAVSMPREGISVFEVEWGGGYLYTSWQGDLSTHTPGGTANTVDINGLYGSKLGLKDGEQVVIKSVSSVPACERLMVEPLSIDDWEILELHAGFIESHLLDQVRVVWAGMIMPIWVQKSICIFIKISSMEPCYSKCSLLEQRTQVVVTPKVRRQNQLPHPTKGSDKTKPDDKHTQQDNTDKGVIKNRVKNDKVISPLACKMPEMEVEASNSDDFLQRVVGMVRSLWSGSVAQTSADTSEQQAPLYREEILGRDLDCNLRVQPYGNLLERQHHRKHRNKKFETGISEEIEDDDNAENDVLNIRMVNIGHQPTIVYINEKTLHDCLPLSESVNNSSLPKTFLATLCRLKSASEKEDLMKKEMKKEKQSRRLAKKEDAEVDLPDDPNDIKHTTVIRVAVLNRTNSYRLYSNQGTQVGKVEFTESHGALPGHVMMHDLLRRQVGCEVMGRLRLEAVHGNAAVDPSQLQLLPLFKLPSDMTSDMVTSAFKMWLWDVSCEQCPLVVTQGTLVKFFLKQDMLGEFLITFTSRQEPSSGESTIPQFCLLHRGIAEKLQVLIKETVNKDSESKLMTHLPRWSLQEIDPVVNLTHRAQLGGVDSIIKQAVDHIRLSLGVTPLPAEVCSGSPGLQMGGLLLCGARGMGKTCLSKAVARCLAQQPYLAYVAVVECKPLRGKRVEVIYRHMEKVLNEAAWRQPSLVVLDDLDVLAAAPSGPEQDMSGEALYHTKVAEMIKDLFIAEIRHKSKIAILATCKSRSSLHTSLTSPKGHHFFQETLEIKPPTEQSRELVLKAILHCKTAINPSCIKDLDLRQVAVKTEGFTPRDLVTLTDRAIHAHYMKQHDLHVTQESKEMSLVDGDIEVALDGFTPAALRGIDLHKAGDTGWQDVGGLHHVRTTLVETLQWPAKYPKLFAQMPLRLRSGLLLYGAPGTGKTLLAGVLAKECGLNFISIKGPELLSKYIGASEQAVRDTFLRAQSAKPCILFFDEFDSLAPRRGHDSTGVTDRVVNQLLTQLDGVEGLEGVYVLGATSRPDLIDPALLRPGRLDKALCCTMPTQDERLEILTALSRKVNFSDDVDLSEISSMCDHFTGADFKALLYNAQLAAIHEMTDSLRGKRISSCSSDSSQDSNAKFEMIEKGNFIALPTDGTDLNVSSKQPPDGSTVHEEDHQTELKVAVSEKAQPGSDKVVLIPTLEEGVVTLEPNTYDKLIKQMERFTVQDAGDSGSGKKLVSGPATIQRKHMLRAARTMNPSVSHQERTRYQMIYENFVASRGGHFGGLSPPGGKKATLA